MMFTRWIRLFTSESVLLTYVFIGYIAISDRLQPSCSVDQVPAFSVSDTMYPSAQTSAVTMEEHVRSLKFLPRYDDVVSFEVKTDAAPNHVLVSTLNAPRPPNKITHVFFNSSPRAPPAYSIY